MHHSTSILKSAAYLIDRIPHWARQHGEPGRGAIYHAMIAMGNCRLARTEDFDELPDTSEQRYLERLGACLEGREWFGYQCIEGALYECPNPDWLEWLWAELEEAAGAQIASHDHNELAYVFVDEMIRNECRR